MTLLTPVYLALRPAEPRAGADRRGRGAAARAAGAPRPTPSATSTSAATRAWSGPTSGKAAIAYRVVVRRHARQRRPDRRPRGVARGDPRRSSTRPTPTPGPPRCSAAPSRPARSGCARRGFAALELGDEAVVDADGLHPRGPPDAQRAPDGQPDRARRLRHRGPPRRATSPEGVRGAALADAAAWRASDTERGFSMALGRLARPGRPRLRVRRRARQDGVVRAFLQFVPWGQDGMSLDVMRRDREADAGVNELLIVAALRGRAGLGISGSRSTSPPSGLPSSAASGSAPGRSCVPGGGCCCSPPAGSRSRASTASTPSSSRSGSPGSSSTRRPPTCPVSAWPVWRPRRSSPGRGWAGSEGRR